MRQNSTVHATEFANSQKLNDRLKKAMVFLITLENGMSPLDKEFLSSKGVPSIISARMLAQLWQCSLDSVRFYPDLPTPGQLCKQLAKNENIEFKDFTAIIVVDGLGSLLISPEDVKNKASRFYTALTACAELALQGAFIIPLCTATITGSPRKHLAETNRCRIYLEPPPLDPPVFKATGVVTDLFVGDCGGHGRALEALYETQRHRFETITNYDDCVSVVVGNLKVRYGDAFRRYYLGLGSRGLH